MDRAAVRHRLGVLRHDAAVTLASRREPEYRRLSRRYRLPEGMRRVYCYHVRKTAGTSLHYGFLGLGGEDPLEVQRRIAGAALHRTVSGGYAFAAHEQRLLEQGHYFYGWSHLPAHHVRLPRRTFTVTILRDPVRRVLSLYSYLLEGDEPGMPFPAPESGRAAARRGFSAFLDELPPKELLRQLFMFSPRFDVAEAADALGRCSAVLFTEDFESGFASLARRLDLPLVSHRARVTRRRVEPSDSELERLRHMVEPEYALLGRLAPSPTVS